MMFLVLAAIMPTSLKALPFPSVSFDGALGSRCSSGTTSFEQGCMLTAPTSYSYEEDNTTSCCMRCAVTSGCRAWSIFYDTAGGPWTGMSHCLIYSRAAPLTPGNCTSGIMRPTPPSPPVQKTPKGARNVLLLIVDDLRPQLGVYGQSGMITPNIDRIGANGVVFKRAYCQIAICGPSRNSFLTGRRPQHTQVWNFVNTFRESNPDWVSFPAYFKMHNYTTLGAGKTYHPKSPPYSDEPASWTQEEGYYQGAFAWPPRPGSPPNNMDVRDDDYDTIYHIPGEGEDANPPTPDSDCLVWPHSILCPRANVTDSYFRDWRVMNATRARIFKYASNNTRPFFLAYGAHRPHLPWSYPRRFWDMYPDNEKIPLPKHEAAPLNMPSVAFTYEMDGNVVVDAMNHSEVLPYPAANTAFTHNMTRTLRRGYYGAVSWCDFLIGELLDALEVAGVAKNTVVALVGDHGWQLGEHNIWGKHTNFELGTRVPFIISSPGHIRPGQSDALAELVDLYPTVAAVAGLPPPSGLDGVDLSPLMNITKITKTATNTSINITTSISAADLKTAAFSEYPRCFLNLSTPWDGYVRPAFGHRQNGWGNCMSTGKHWIRAMGYSVRTPGYRYTVWLPWDGRRIQGDFDAHPLGEELYLHGDDDGSDFDAFENENVVADPAYASVVKDLFARAKTQWDAVPPPPSPRCTAVRHGHVEQGVEVVGGDDTLPLTHTPGTSVMDCCQQCGATSNCSYFSFSVEGGMCRFHSSVSGLVNNADLVAGALDDASPLPPAPAPTPSPPTPAPKPPKPLPPYEGCKMEKRVRYTGDLLSYIPADSEKQCCSKCGNAAGCTAFTFTPQSLLCSCLSSVTGVVDDMDTISGNTSAVFELKKAM